MILPQAPHVPLGCSRGPSLPFPAVTVPYCIIKCAEVDGTETAYECAARSRKLNLAFCAKSPIISNAVVTKRSREASSLEFYFRVVMFDSYTEKSG